MLGLSLTVEAIVSLYLYGTNSPPDAWENTRFRPASVEAFSIDLDVPIYMSGAARYASIFQTKAVTDFFSGNLDLSGYPADAAGRIVVHLADIVGLSTTDTAVTVSNYTTGIGDVDFAVRAFIFGTASFTSTLKPSLSLKARTATLRALA